MTIEELAKDLHQALTKDEWPDWLVSVGHSEHELFVYVNSLANSVVPLYYKNHRVKTRAVYLNCS